MRTRRRRSRRSPVGRTVGRPRRDQRLYGLASPAHEDQTVTRDPNRGDRTLAGLIKHTPKTAEPVDVFDRFDHLFDNWSRMLPFRRPEVFGREWTTEPESTG